MSKENGKKSGHQTHYETLGLHENCTEKEVKDAFVSLSKAHHPDLHPNDPGQNEKFLEIYEAYSVLGKPQKRLVYDSNLRNPHFRNPQQWNGSRVETDAPRYTVWKDESLWSMRDKTSEDFNKNKPYYGVKGINRVSNYWIAGGAVVVMLIGALFHYAAFKHSVTFNLNNIHTRDEKHAMELFKARQRAMRNGNDVQIELLREKFGWTPTPEPPDDKSNSTE